MTTAAVVGIGDISGNHLSAIADNPAIDLVAVCDVLPARAAAAGQRWGVPSFTDHLTMLAETRPDVVHITLPHYLHAPVAIDALRAGSHVLTEKPLAHTVAAGRELADAARASDRKLAVCFQNRYNPTSRALHDAVQSGRFGEIRGDHLLVPRRRLLRRRAVAGHLGPGRRRHADQPGDPHHRPALLDAGRAVRRIGLGEQPAPA